MRVLLLIAALALTSCEYIGRDVRLVLDGSYPEKLSGWRLFRGDLARQEPNEGVLPYDLNTPLFSDYATKWRFVWMPKGTSAQYRGEEAFEFPQGAVLVKTFAYPGRILETRILINGRAGWTALPYVWNAAQTEAVLDVAPSAVEVAYTDPSGRRMDIHYMIPNTDQCKGCHESAKRVLPIGAKARHLNKDFAYPAGRENQLVHWTKIGYLTGAPTPEAAPRNAAQDAADLNARVRAYFDINCAHCHDAQGAANTSGLYLRASERDPLRLGFCKVPVAAGHGSGDLLFDIVPARPEESILLRRLNSVEPKVVMPEFGRATVHTEAVQMIREWIASTKGECGK